jgi:hypothetical protein
MTNQKLELHWQGEEDYRLISIEQQCWRNENGNHREDGPAVIYSTGEEEYWVDGKKCTEEDFPKCLLQYRLTQIIEK